jgi:hypothetical protein
VVVEEDGNQEDTDMTQRTDHQNAALHLFFRQLAQAMQDADIDLKKLVEAKAVSVPMTEEMVKSVIWKPIQQTMYGKLSTTELDRAKEISDIYDVVNRHMIENFSDDGLVVPPFPSYEEQLNESRMKE